MEEKYGVQVMPVNCEQLKKEDIKAILEEILHEFPVTEIDFTIPKWMEILPREHWLKSRVIQTVKEMLKKTDHMRLSLIHICGGLYYGCNWCDWIRNVGDSSVPASL